ncbi:hypothetical protein HON03_01710 [archaeon]|jgi:hypothetical protein|nr:hypothetical protein [archaeon]MBT5288243.1 hypothetical protein [archaeon]
MKKILLALMVLSLLVVVGCATEEGTVCFTEEELEEMNLVLDEVTGEEESDIQYAPGAREEIKENIMSRIRTVNTFFASYDGELVGISGVGLKDSKSTDDSGKGESTAGEDEAVAAESEDSEEDGV